MRIQYASDLHLEFGENTKWLKENPLVPSVDIHVLAGDIGYLGDANYRTHPFWDWVSANLRQVIIVPGNHELFKFFDINELLSGDSTECKGILQFRYSPSRSNFARKNATCRDSIITGGK